MAWDSDEGPWDIRLKVCLPCCLVSAAESHQLPSFFPPGASLSSCCYRYSKRTVGLVVAVRCVCGDSVPNISCCWGLTDVFALLHELADVRRLHSWVFNRMLPVSLASYQ